MRDSDARPSCDPDHPWAPMPMPPLRSGPPYLMADSMALEAAVAERLVADTAANGSAVRIADLLRSTAFGESPSGWPPTIVGCGTSEHAGIASAAIWNEAWRRAGLPGPGPISRQAFEAAQDPWPGTTIGISHEGATWATLEAMRAARGRGAHLGLVTAAANGPGARLADAYLCTGEVDHSWCHTIGYLAPIVAAAAVGAALTGDRLDGTVIRDLVAGGMGADEPAAALARSLGSARTLIVTATGADRAAGREMTLKVEEACYVPTRFRDLETLLHGHIPSMDVGTAMVLILTDRSAFPARLARTRQLLTAVSRIGVRAGAILSESAAEAVPQALTPAGRVVVAEAPGLPAPVAALIGSAPALQLTVYHLALTLGTNPDVLLREFPPYRAAAELSEAGATD